MNQKQSQSAVEPAWSRYIHAKGARLGLPIAGNFEITSRCNFNCKMCYIHDNAAQGELSAAEWIEIGRQAAGAGMVFLLITGGEPLIRKDFPEIYLGLKKLGLLISINTNASLLTDELFEMFRKEPPLRMNISLYGASNETYRRFCGSASYDTVVRNIRRLRDAGIPIRLNGSITPLNGGDVPALYKFAQEENLLLKATSYMFPPVRLEKEAWGQGPNRFTAEEAAAMTLLCREQYLTKEQLCSGQTPECVIPDEEEGGTGSGVRCRAGSTAFWLTWDGRMLPCGMFPVDGYSVREMGFDQAWRQVRAYTQTLRMPGSCTVCAYRNQCPSCAAACLTETGTTSRRPDYICRMTQTLAELIRTKYGHGGEQ